MKDKSEMIANLMRMLSDMLRARSQGVHVGRMARAHGYVDGYMKALLDMGVATQRELLAVVAAEREKVGGAPVEEISHFETKAA